MRVQISLSLSVLLLVLWHGVASAVPVELSAEGIMEEHYDCTLTLTPAASLPDTSPLRLDCGKMQLTLTKSTLTLSLSGHGAPQPLAQLPAGVQPGAPYQFSVLRRGEWFAVQRGEALLCRCHVPNAGHPPQRIDAGRGWTVTQAQLQSRDPVTFADNFMRTADGPGQWTIARGQWMLHSVWDNDLRNSRRRFDLVPFAQNPFAWVGRAPGGSALCTVGAPTWDDYTCTVAVHPAADGVVGALVNMHDAHSGLLVRWSSAADHGDGGDSLRLCRMDAGKLTTLAQTHGGFLPGQWYALSVVSSLAGVRVLIDGRERLNVPNATPWRGGVGLYAEGEGGVFNDVTVYGQTLKTDLLAEHRLARYAQRVKDDLKGMGEWSSVQGDWHAFPGVPSGQLHRLPFYGEHWLTLPVKTTGDHDATLTMMLDSNGVDITSGVRAVIRRAAGTGRLTCTLHAAQKTLATRILPPLSGEDDYTFRFSRDGERLHLELDGHPVLAATTASPVTGHQTAYLLSGDFVAAGDALALGHQVLDYSFAEAPVDWRAAGAWMPSNRWSCSSHWSFLGGWGRGDAVLWQKNRFAGDQLFEAFVATKTEYPRERQIYWNSERERDYAITICGDGQDPRTGYAGIYGASASYATPDKRTVLLRNGVEVGSAPIFPPSSSEGHTAWFHLELRKTGDTVEFWVRGKLAVRFTDPHPIEGGVPAVWASDNGLAVARTRISYAMPPEPREDTQVTLDDPWYPAWADIGRPLTVDFPNAVASSGRAVQLAVTARSVPDTEHAVPAVQGTRVTLTPQAAGDHWYEIRAGDGSTQSPPFHLAVPVFTPALGRDDAHAIVLYRFDEGQGNVVKDHGAGAPADLLIPTTAPVAWRAGQGLWLHGWGPIQTTGGVPKLMALATHKAATFEVWIDTDTVCPPTDWMGGLLAWERPKEERNLVIAQMFLNLVVMPQGATFEPVHGGAAYAPNCMRTGLQHVVVTWDGTVTRCYSNGNLLHEFHLDWHPERWVADTPLLLGSLAVGQPHYHDAVAHFLGPREDILADEQDLQHCYLGAFYLAAIHDRCFTADDVKHNYLAGPSAR